MGKRLKNYLLFIEQEIQSDLAAEDKESLRQELLVQISFFQHERLIHLIVTVTFAILTILTFLATLLIEQIALWALLALFVILLIPYVAHYYKLENGVQKLYTFYDQLSVK